MTTDTMGDHLDEWHQMARSGKYLKSDLMKFAYQQGQRDLIDAMGEPVCYITPDGTVRVKSLDKPKAKNNWLGLYSLPEDAPK